MWISCKIKKENRPARKLSGKKSGLVFGYFLKVAIFVARIQSILCNSQPEKYNQSSPMWLFFFPKKYL